MVLRSLSLEGWLAALTEVRGVSDGAAKNFTAEDTKVAEVRQESEKEFC